MSASPEAQPDEFAPPPATRLWWLVPGVGIVLLALFAMLFGGTQETVDYGTSYDASDSGFRAAYLLLEELKYPVERSRRLTGGEIRWVLFPNHVDAKLGQELDAWVQRGGLLLLATDEPDLPRQLGLEVTVHQPFKLSHQPQGTSRPASAPDVRSLIAGDTQVNGPRDGRAWGTIDGRPLITIYSRGHGEVWLVNRPDVFTNTNLHGEADNAILTCRLADAMLRERPKSNLLFDEYSHGLRDRPDVMELLFRPPARGVTLEMMLLTALVLWHFGSRFGQVRPPKPLSRRSKEEFLDAMAELLTRKGDRAEAFREVRDDFLLRLQEHLGLPSLATPKETAQEAGRRRGLPEEPLLELLTASSPPQGTGTAAFLAALHQLETFSNECLQFGRRPR
jgi:hypothetical protein